MNFKDSIRSDLGKIVNDDFRSAIKSDLTSNISFINNSLTEAIKKEVMNYSTLIIDENINQDILNIENISHEYNILLNDESVINPFMISSELINIANNQIKGCSTPIESAKKLYNWCEENIRYSKSDRNRGYKNPKEVLNEKNGICAEMAFVYVMMARGCGISSYWAVVNKDFKGDKVNHACAAIFLDQEPILVDVAYHTFDIKHKDYEIWNDWKVIQHYNDVRK